VVVRVRHLKLEAAFLCPLHGEDKHGAGRDCLDNACAPLGEDRAQRIGVRVVDVEDSGEGGLGRVVVFKRQRRVLRHEPSGPGTGGDGGNENQGSGLEQAVHGSLLSCR